MPDDILYKTDRMSMAHSLEVRPPFLDHRIVEFAARLPEDLKIRGSTLKYVLRELMRDKLPPSVLTPKEGRLRHSGASVVPDHPQAAVTGNDQPRERRRDGTFPLAGCASAIADISTAARTMAITSGAC